MTERFVAGHQAEYLLEVGRTFLGLAKLIPPEVQRRFLSALVSGGQNQEIREELGREFQMQLTWVPPELLYGLVGVVWGATSEHDSVADTPLKINLMEYMTNHPDTVFIVCKGLARFLYQKMVLGRDKLREVPRKIGRDPYYLGIIGRENLDWDIDFWAADASGGFDLEKFAEEFSVRRFRGGHNNASVTVRPSPRKEGFACVNVYLPAPMDARGFGENSVRRVWRAALRKPFAHFCALDEGSLVATMAREPNIPPIVLAPIKDASGKVINIGGVMINPYGGMGNKEHYIYFFEKQVFPEDKPGWCLESIFNSLVDCAFDKMEPAIWQDGRLLSSGESALVVQSQVARVTERWARESTSPGLRIDFLKANGEFAVRKLMQAFKGDSTSTFQRCMAWGVFEKDGIFPRLGRIFQDKAGTGDLSLIEFLLRETGSIQETAKVLMPPWYPGTTDEFAKTILVLWDKDFVHCQATAEERTLFGQEEKIIKLIANSPKPLTPGELAACLRKTPAAVYTGLTRLNKQGVISDLSIHLDLTAIKTTGFWRENRGTKSYRWTDNGQWMTAERAGEFGTDYYSEVSRIYMAVKTGPSDPEEDDYVSLREIQKRTGLTKKRILTLTWNLEGIVGQDENGYFIRADYLIALQRMIY